MTAEQWNQMMVDNDWNEVELRDSRYNQVVHMMSIADASTGRRRHFSSHEGMDIQTARQLDLAISQVHASANLVKLSKIIVYSVSFCGVFGFFFLTVAILFIIRLVIRSTPKS